MNLSEDQLKSVSAWFAAGASLDEIQKRLVSEFGVHMTYFDLRMLVADLPQPEEKEAEAPETSQNQAQGEGGQDDGMPSDQDAQERVPPEGDAEDGDSPPGDEGDGAASSVSVTVDALMIPGTVASGDVVFSDGVKGKWYLDQVGRLGLGGDNLPQGYRPSPADAALFQARLMEALRAKGMC